MLVLKLLKQKFIFILLAQPNPTYTQTSNKRPSAYLIGLYKLYRIFGQQIGEKFILNHNK